jgi:hypothetical protein
MYHLKTDPLLRSLGRSLSEVNRSLHMRRGQPGLHPEEADAGQTMFVTTVAVSVARTAASQVRLQASIQLLYRLMPILASTWND